MLIPAIDLKGGKVVQLIQGEKLAIETTDLDYWITYFDRNPGERYVSDGDAATITVASGSAGRVGAVRTSRVVERR